MAGIIAGVPRLARNSIVVGYDTEVQAIANIQDIYTNLQGTYNRKNESWPTDAIRMKVKDQSVSESVITLKEKLSEPGVYANQQAEGTEEPPDTKSCKVYQNNYRKVIPKPGYGLRKLETDKYKLYDLHKQDVGEWNKEEHGYQIRMALLERYAPNLLEGDTRLSCTQWWNPNVFIPTAGLYNQPIFHTNRAIHTNRICTRLQTTGGFAQFSARTLTAPVLDDLSNWALHKRLRRLRIPGLPTGSGFVLTISELQAALISNPTVAANNLGAMYTPFQALPEMVQKYRGVIGSYSDILLVCDPRIPTVLPGGSATPFSLDAGYMVWNSTDLRHRTHQHVKDVAILHGAGALVEVEGEKLHWIADERDYAFHQGLGTAGVRGDQIPIFIDEETNAIAQITSAVCFLDLPNQGTLAS